MPKSIEELKKEMKKNDEAIKVDKEKKVEPEVKKVVEEEVVEVVEEEVVEAEEEEEEELVEVKKKIDYILERDGGWIAQILFDDEVGTCQQFEAKTKKGIEKKIANYKMYV